MADGTRRIQYVGLLTLAAGLLLLLFADTAAAAPLAGANANIDQVCAQNNGSTFTSFTSAANDATTNDVGQIDNNGGANYKEVYFGMNSVFDKLYVKYSTAGTVGTVTWEYWNGAWSALSAVNDGTGNLKSAAGTYTVTWTLPSDWSTTTINATCSASNFYYMRLRVTATYGTNPRLDQISAIEYNLKVRVNDELGNAMTGLTSTDFAAANGTTTTIFGSYEIGSGDYYLALDMLGADHNFDVNVVKDGYVTSANLAGGTGVLTTSLTDKTGSAFTMIYGQKVTVTREVDGTAFSGATVTGGSVTFTESGSTGIYYGAVLVANDGGTITITKAGYVTNTAYTMSNRATNNALQGDTTASGVKFSQKVTVTREADSAAFSGATVTSGGATFIESGSTGIYYGAVTIANDNAAITIAKAGYVTNTAFSTTDRTANGDAQGSTSATGINFGQKVTVTREVDAAAVSGATVTSGGVTFIESGSTGVYYGAVLIANDNAAITIVKSGYVTNAAFSTTDRTADTDAQGSTSATNVKFSQKVTVTRELDGAAFSGATVTSSAITFVESGATGVYYGVVPTTSDGATITIAKAGYVTNTAFLTTDRAADADAQGAVAASNVRFGQKVTVVREVDAAAFSGATVTSASVTFTEDGSTGIYYGAVAIGSDGATITISKSGYVTNTAWSTADRTADADAQGDITATGIKFAQKVTVTREGDAGALNGATVTSSSVTFIENAATGIYYGAVPIASDGVTITIAKAGYVTNTAYATTDRTANTDAQGTVSATNVKFGQKVTITREVDSSALTGATVTSNSITFTEIPALSGVYYGVMTPAQDGQAISIVRSGYVTNTASSTTDRSADSDAQGSASPINIRFSQKVTVTREVDTAAFSGATVTSGGATFIEDGSTGIYYGAVSIANDNAAITIAKAGYVTNTATSTTDRTADADAQGSSSATNIRFGQKITVTREVDVAAFSGATVTSAAVTFLESGSTGIYYAAIPIGSDNAAITIAKPGYVTNTAYSTTDRTADTDAQGSGTASNIQFGQKVTVTREVDSAAISGATVTSGGATFIESGSTGIYYGAVSIANDNAAITIVKAGHVTNTAYNTVNRVADADAQGSTSATGVLFAQKVTVTREADAGAISGATVTSAAVTFVENGATGVYYAAIPIGNDNAAITIVKAGYVTNTAYNTVDRTADADAQGSRSASNVQFSQKITITREVDGGALTGATVTSAAITFVESAGTYYGAIPIGSDNAAITIVKAGYVTDTASSTTDRTADADAQGSGVSSNIRFGQKVTITREIDSGALSGATVTSGGATFIEDGSTGVYYGAVLIGSDNAAITVAKAGYVTNTAFSTTDRTADTDAQGSTSATNVKFSQKVTITREADASAVTGATVTSGGATFIESGATGVYYGAVLIGSDNAAITIVKAGHVTNTAFSTTDRTADTDAQGSVSATNVRFGQKITVAREADSGVITGATVTSNSITFTEIPALSGAYYGVMTPAQDNQAITVVKSGYVTNSAFSTADRSADADAQGSTSVTALQFGQKVTLARQVDGGSLTGATVTSNSITFNELPAASGNYYAIMTPAQDNLAITAQKDGYVTNTAFSTVDRAAATDAQGSTAVTGILFGQKVTATREADAAALSGATVTSGGASFIEDGSTGVYYGAVPVANDGAAITIAKDAYVTNTAASTTDRSAHTDAQGDVAAANVRFTLKITLATETGLGGVSFEKKIGAGGYNSVSPTVSSANIAYFAQSPSEADLVYRASKYSVSADTGAAFTTSAASQTAYSLDLVGALSSTSSSAVSLVAGAQTTYTFGFTAAHVWPANGKMSFTLPATYTIGSPAVTLTGADGTATSGVAGQVVTITRANDGTDTAGSTAITVALTQVTNPHVSGSGGTFAFALKSNAGTTLDSGTGPAVTITPGALASLSTDAATLEAGVETTYTFGFTNANPWPASGKLTATFPAAFVLGTPDVTLTGADGTATASVSGQVVTVTRSGDGTQTAASTAITVALSEVTSPTATGATGTFALAMRSAASVDIDLGDAPSLTILWGPLDHIVVAPNDPTVVAGEVQGFTATGYDAFDNVRPTTPVWGASCGSVDQAGSFTAPTAAPNSCDVTATDGAVFDSSSASIVADELADITLLPAHPLIPATTTRQFSAAGLDQYGNSVAITPDWTSDCGTIDASGLFTAPSTAQACVVTVEELPISNETSLSVTAAPLTKLAAGAASAVVGTNTVYSFKFVNGDPWPVAGKAQITFPAGITVGTPVVTLAGAKGTATASVSGQVVTVTRSGDGILTPTSTGITIKLTDITNPINAGTTGTFPVVLQDGDGNAINSGTAAGIVIKATTFAAKLTGGSSTVDAVTTYTSEATLPVAWPADAKWIVQFPAGFDVSGATHSFTGADGTATLSTSGTTVTVTRNGDGTQTPAESVVSLVLNNIRNQPTSGVTAKPLEALRTSAGLDLASGNAGALKIVSTTLKTAVALPSVYAAGASTPILFTVSSTVAWPADGSLVIGMPAGLTASAPTATIVSGADGNATASVSGSTVTVTRNGDGTQTPALTLVKISVDGFTNPPVATALKPVSLALRTAAGVDLGAATAAGPKIVAEALTGTSSKAASLLQGATGAYTFVFKAPRAWPLDGKFSVTFADDYVIGSPALAIKGVTGTASVSVSGQTVTVTRNGDGANLSALGAVTVTLTDITNPSWGGLTSTFAMALRQADNTLIDSGSAAGVKLATGALTGLTSSALSLTGGVETTYTFGVTNANPWPANGKFIVTLPAGFYVGTPAATLTGADGTASASASGLTVTVTRSGDGTTTAALTPITVSISGIYNTNKAGNTGAFVSSLATNAAKTLDSGKQPVVPIVANPLSINKLVSSSHGAGKWMSSQNVVLKWALPTDLTTDGYSWDLDVNPDEASDGNVLTTTLNGVAEGQHTFIAKAKNAVGTWGPYVRAEKIWIDSTVPVAPAVSSVTHPEGICAPATNGFFSWGGASDALSGLSAKKPYGYKLDSASVKQGTFTSVTLTGLASGSHTLTVYSYDQAGNASPTAYNFEVC